MPTPTGLPYRKFLQANGTEPVPLPGTGSGATVDNNAKALLESGGNPMIFPPGPTQEILPSPGAGGSETAVSEPIANTAVVQTTTTQTGLGSGLLEWVKQNPLPALGVAIGGYFLIKELLKPGKK